MRSLIVLWRKYNPLTPIRTDLLPHYHQTPLNGQLLDCRPSPGRIQSITSSRRSYGHSSRWINQGPVVAAGAKTTTEVEVLVVGGGQIWADQIGGTYTTKAPHYRLN